MEWNRSIEESSIVIGHFYFLFNFSLRIKLFFFLPCYYFLSRGKHTAAAHLHQEYGIVPFNVESLHTDIGVSIGVVEPAT